jgi:hypothetical protein
MERPLLSAQIDEFIDRYAPEMARAIRECRAKMQAFFPRGYELVYDNYNALVFGYAASAKTSEALVSIAAYPKWITLFFLQGAKLSDPLSILEGTGHQVRGIRLVEAGDLDKVEVRNLIGQAQVPWATKFESAPALCTLVKSISAKQRPRRPGQKPPLPSSARNRAHSPGAQ